MKSIALVIGVNDYDNVTPLTNPHHDVDSMADVLQKIQFDVTAKKDVTLSSMGVEIGKFQTACANYEVALFYFSGHGFQHKGENYLCVKDTQLGSVEIITNTSKKLEDVFKMIPDNIKVKIFILDACRNQVKGAKGIAGGLCPVMAPQGSIVAFATSPDDSAYEGIDRDGCSQYTSCLLQHIETRGISIEECFKRVRTTLYARSKGQQLSWEHTSLIGDYSFNNMPIFPKGVLPIYSQHAIADTTFVNDGSDAGLVIESLRSHDWYKQNDAIKKFLHLKPDNIDADTQFVLGRNIYQTACGGSHDAMSVFQNLKPTLLKWQSVDGNNHLLNGILFEIYFNRDGNIRNIGQMKTGWFDVVMKYEDDKSFVKSFDFIKVQLEPYATMLFYIPGNGSPKVSFQIELKEEKDVIGQSFYIINNILMDGRSVYDKPEFNSAYTRTWKELKESIKAYTAIPGKNIVLESNVPDICDNTRVTLDYPFKLSMA